MDWQYKYLKYKYKYFQLKNSTDGGCYAIRTDQLNNGIKREIDCLSELQEYSSFEYQPSKSASKTIQMFAKKNQLGDVFLKIYGGDFSNREPLDIEGRIYNNHIKYLCEKNITPNLVEGIDFFMCNNDGSEVKKKLIELANIPSQINKLNNILPDGEPISFIVTERIGTTDNSPETLHSYMEKIVYTLIENNDIDIGKTVQEMRAIIFQLFYTYDVMKKIGLYHGGLHSKNILLDDRPIDAIYELIDGTRHHIKSNYTVKIFDFDKSSVIKDLSNIDKRLFSITCKTCNPRRWTEYEENGFEKMNLSVMEYNISGILRGEYRLSPNPQLERDFLRILNILLYNSDTDKKIDKWEGEIPIDFSSRLNKLIPPYVGQRESDYKIPKEIGI